MTISYLKTQATLLSYLKTSDPEKYDRTLKDLKECLEAYIEQYGLPEMWAAELRKQLE